MEYDLLLLFHTLVFFILALDSAITSQDFFTQQFFTQETDNGTVCVKLINNGATTMKSYWHSFGTLLMYQELQPI